MLNVLRTPTLAYSWVESPCSGAAQDHDHSVLYHTLFWKNQNSEYSFHCMCNCFCTITKLKNHRSYHLTWGPGTGH